MDGDDEELVGQLEREVAIIQRCRTIEDRLVNGVDLFPLPGVTPGLTGLLIPGADADGSDLRGRRADGGAPGDWQSPASGG